MHGKDYEDVASALRSAVDRLYAELAPGGRLESIDTSDVRRVVAVVAAGMSDWFADTNPYRFNPETFLSACGLLTDVNAMTPAATGRHRHQPIRYDDVRNGDCLSYFTSGGRNRAGVVTMVTDLAVTLDRGWDFEHDFEVYGKVKLRRSNWSRHHVHLMDPSDLPHPRGASTEKSHQCGGPSVSKPAEASNHGIGRRIRPTAWPNGSAQTQQPAVAVIPVLPARALRAVAGAATPRLAGCFRATG
jgi:hypothetical protein